MKDNPNDITCVWPGVHHCRTSRQTSASAAKVVACKPPKRQAEEGNLMEVTADSDIIQLNSSSQLTYDKLLLLNGKRAQLYLSSHPPTRWSFLSAFVFKICFPLRATGRINAPVKNALLTPWWDTVTQHRDGQLGSVTVQCMLGNVPLLLSWQWTSGTLAL